MSFVCALLVAANCWWCVVLFGKLSMSINRLNLWLLVRDGAITLKLNAVHRPLFVHDLERRARWRTHTLTSKNIIIFRSGEIDHFILVNFCWVFICDFRQRSRRWIWRVFTFEFSIFVAKRNCVVGLHGELYLFSGPKQLPVTGECHAFVQFQFHFITMWKCDPAPTRS